MQVHTFPGVRGQRPESTRPRQVSPVFLRDAHSKLADPEASMPREAASHLSLSVARIMDAYKHILFFYIGSKD